MFKAVVDRTLRPESCTSEEVELRSIYMLYLFINLHTRRMYFILIFVFLCSLSGRLPFPLCQDYTATKFGLDGYFTALKNELKMRNLPLSLTLIFLGFAGKF